jgi:hypothetical protein
VHQYGPTTWIGRRFTPLAKRIANRLKRNAGTGHSSAGGRAPSAGLLRLVLSSVSLGTGWCRSLSNWARHRRTDVLILDRYYSDEVIRAAHKFGGVSRFGRWLMRAVPRPHVVFTFTLDPRVGWERKKTREMTLEEYAEKTEIARRTLIEGARIWPVVTIDIDHKAPEAVAETIWDEVRRRRVLRR